MAEVQIHTEDESIFLEVSDKEGLAIKDIFDCVQAHREAWGICVDKRKKVGAEERRARVASAAQQVFLVGGRFFKFGQARLGSARRGEARQDKEIKKRKALL